MCRSWICAEGIYNGTSGNKGVDKLNAAYQQSKSANADSGGHTGMDGFQSVMDFFNNACKGGFRS